MAQPPGGRSRQASTRDVSGRRLQSAGGFVSFTGIDPSWCVHSIAQADDNAIYIS
jgi:hypothetical protein